MNPPWSISAAVITTSGWGPSISVLLILDPVTLIFESSTSSPLASDELDSEGAGADSASVSATTSSATSSAWATTSPGLSAYKLEIKAKFDASKTDKNKFLLFNIVISP